MCRPEPLWIVFGEWIRPGNAPGGYGRTAGKEEKLSRLKTLDLPRYR